MRKQPQIEPATQSAGTPPSVHDRRPPPADELRRRYISAPISTSHRRRHSNAVGHALESTQNNSTCYAQANEAHEDSNEHHPQQPYYPNQELAQSVPAVSDPYRQSTSRVPFFYGGTQAAVSPTSASDASMPRRGVFRSLQRFNHTSFADASNDRPRSMAAVTSPSSFIHGQLGGVESYAQQESAISPTYSNANDLAGPDEGPQPTSSPAITSGTSALNPYSAQPFQSNPFDCDAAAGNENEHTNTPISIEDTFRDYMSSNEEEFWAPVLRDAYRSAPARMPTRELPISEEGPCAPPAPEQPRTSPPRLESLSSQPEDSLFALGPQSSQDNALDLDAGPEDAVPPGRRVVTFKARNLPSPLILHEPSLGSNRSPSTPVLRSLPLQRRERARDWVNRLDLPVSNPGFPSLQPLSDPPSDYREQPFLPPPLPPHNAAPGLPTQPAPNMAQAQTPYPYPIFGHRHPTVDDDEPGNEISCPLPGCACTIRNTTQSICRHFYSVCMSPFIPRAVLEARNRGELPDRDTEFGIRCPVRKHNRRQAYATLVGFVKHVIQVHGRLRRTMPYLCKDCPAVFLRPLERSEHVSFGTACEDCGMLVKCGYKIHQCRI